MLNECSRRMLACTILENSFDDVDVFRAGHVNVGIQKLLAGVDLDLQDAKTVRSRASQPVTRNANRR